MAKKKVTKKDNTKVVEKYLRKETAMGKLRVSKAVIEPKVYRAELNGYEIEFELKGVDKITMRPGKSWHSDFTFENSSWETIVAMANLFSSVVQHAKKHYSDNLETFN